MEQLEQKVGERVALSQQQRKFSQSGGKLDLYRELLCGDAGWLEFLGFELYTSLLSGLPGLFGYGARSLVLPRFLRSARGGLAIGKGVTIRQPNRISVGRGVILDDYSVVDYRSQPNDQSGGITLEDHVLVGRNSLVVSKGGTIHLRAGCNLSSFCRIATQSRVDIGESVLIAAYAYIGPGNHQTGDLAQPIIEREMEIKGGVSIGANSWIGAHTIVLDGVKIGRDAIIGANSLVRDDIPDRAIAVGNPARVVRFRDEHGG